MTRQSYDEALPVRVADRRARPSHPGTGRRVVSVASPALLPLAAPIDRAGQFIQKFANTLRFERFWRERVYGDPDTIIVPRFDKISKKHSIWNVAISDILQMNAPGSVVEFGTNNGGWLSYFVERLPATINFVGFDCFEGLPEPWDGLPAGSIKGHGFPSELWRTIDEKEHALASFRETGIMPAPPQPNVRIEVGLFSESLPRFLRGGWPHDLRLVHFDADLYMSTRPVLDTLCGPLKHRYLILFDEFYSANHEFRAWREFTSVFNLDEWRVAAASEDGSQILVEVNSTAGSAGRDLNR